MENKSQSPEVFAIPSHRMDDLRKKVERFERKAAKLGLPAVSLEITGEKLVEETGKWGEKTGRIFVYTLVELHGEAPVVEGHTFVARVEHTEAGNIVSKAPGAHEVEIPVEFRDGAPTCDHCKTFRRRNDTFILRVDESGKFIRVGRNCLADYLRSKDAGEALSVWALLSDLRRISEDDGEDSEGGCYSSLESYVACAFRSVQLLGWVSKKDAYYSDKTATATDAAFACNPRPQRPEAARAWDLAQPNEKNIEDAKAAIEWAKSLEGASDYEHNLKIACSLEYVKAKNYGIVASVVVGFNRYRERELKRASKADKKESVHFGNVGGRYVRKLTVVRTNSWDSAYGITVLYTLQDGEGNTFKWFSSGGCGHPEERRELDIEDELFFTFTVKAHGEYKGALDTTITRATASVEAPSAKWFNPETGEIFKTKKALNAALAA